jgi:signal transduction histidine kinase
VEGTPGWLRAEPDEQGPPVRVWHDWLLFVLVAAAATVDAVRREDPTGAAVAAVLGLTLALTMLWRRTRPLAMVMLGVGGLLVVDVASLLIAGEPFYPYAGAAVLVLVFSLFRWGNGRQAALGTPVVLVLWLLSMVSDFSGVADAVGGLVVLAFSAALGLALRYRRMVRAQQFERVRLQERELLARELHDTVAHHVSAIAIQAQAGQFLADSRDLGGAADALRLIADEASRTMAEMRSMVGTLRERDGTAALSAQRGVADIERLVGAEGVSGVRIDVERHGDLDHLLPAVASALYRVAQESITNAKRHVRHARRVHVVVSGEADNVRLTVSDDGDRGLNPRPGYGLVGMNERVTLLGGTLEAGPRADHGWTVRATIPRRGNQG